MKRCNLFFIILFVFILSYSRAEAQIQWQGTSIHETVVDLQWHNNKAYLLTKKGFYSSADDQTWQKLKTITATDDYTSIVFLPSGELFLFGYGYYSISTDSGATWKKVTQVKFSTRTCIVDNVGNLYAGENDPIYLSTDKGKTWKNSTNGTSPDFFDIGVIVLAPNGDVYAGNQGISGGMVYRSTDHGSSWKLMHSENMIDVSFIAISNGTIWIAYTHKLIYSDDDGASWNTASETPFPISALLFTGENDALAGMYSLGLFSTADRCNTWDSNMSGIHGKNVNRLVRSPSGKIFCGTDSGLFYYTPQAGVKEDHEAGTALILSPNPAYDNVRIQPNFSSGSKCSVEIYDQTGRKKLSKEMDGQNDLLNTESLSNGSYFVVTKSKDEVKTSKLIIAK